MAGWYVLDGGAPDRYLPPMPDDELPRTLPAGDRTFDATFFRGHLIHRVLAGRWFLRLWWTEQPLDRYSADQGDCLLAVGPMNDVVVEMRRTLDGVVHRYRVARRGSAESGERIIRFNLGHAVTARAEEVFDVDAVTDLFYAYYRTGTVPESDYVLRKLDSPDVWTDFGAPTQVLTIDYDCYRPVLPTVGEGEFAPLLPAAAGESAVLVLSALPDRDWADLADEDLAGCEEFLQVAGSGGRYVVEWRLWTGYHYQQYLVGHHATSPLESMKETLRQLDEVGEEMQATLAALADSTELLEIPQFTWASLPEIQAAEVVYADPSMAPPKPEEAKSSAAGQPDPPDESPLAPIIPLRSRVSSPPDQAPASTEDPGFLPRIDPLPVDDVQITFGDQVRYVYPNEVFAPAEVDVLFLHYARTGRLPELGLSYREVILDRDA